MKTLYWISVGLLIAEQLVAALSRGLATHRNDRAALDRIREADNNALALFSAVMVALIAAKFLGVVK